MPQRRTLKHTLFNVPEKLNGRRRKSALKLKVDAWSPFSNTDYVAAWSNNKASVFAWDADDLSNRVLKHGYDINSCDIVPEAFLRRPHTDGIRLIDSIDGIEAQVWNNGFLETTRWWAAEPPKQEWSLFLRSAGMPSSTSTPAVEAPDWMDFPWNNAALSNNMFSQALRNDRFVAFVCILLLAPCVFFSFEALSYSVLAARNGQSIKQIEEDTRPIRLDRTRALTALDTVEDLISLNPYPHQIEILARAHNLLRPHTITLANWDYDEGALEFGILSDSDMDPRVFITAFEEDPMFSEVSASTSGQRLVLRMSIESDTKGDRL